jgi:fibronectin-binding autotransporter adhesin
MMRTKIRQRLRARRYLIAAVIGALPGSALAIAWNGTDPTFSAVNVNGLTNNYGQFTNESYIQNNAISVRGTCTYLANGWFLTAQHVAENSGGYGTYASPSQMQINVYGTNYTADSFSTFGSADILLVHVAGSTSGTITSLTGVEKRQVAGFGDGLAQIGGFGLWGQLDGTISSSIAFHRAFTTPSLSSPFLYINTNPNSRLINDGYMLGIDQGGDSGSGMWEDNGPSDQDLDLWDWSLTGECQTGGSATFYSSGGYGFLQSYESQIWSTVYPHAVLTWNANSSAGTTAVDGSGTWDLASTNWTDGTNYAFNGPERTEQAIFGAGNGAAGTVTVGANIPVDQIIFNAAGSGNYTIASSGSNVLQLQAGTFITTNVDATISANMQGVLSTQYGWSGVTQMVEKNGTGTLTLTGTTTLPNGMAFYARAGTTVIGSGGNFNCGYYTSVAVYSGETATLTLMGTGAYNGAGQDFNLADLGGTAVLNVQDSATLNVGQLYVGKGSTRTVVDGTTPYSAPGTGTVNQSGGTVTASGFVSLGSFNTGSVGTYNLNGGVLNTASIQQGTGQGTFNFNGGTLTASASNASFMQGLTSATVGAGGAIINSSGNNITIAQPLAHTGASTDGGLTKQGSGILTLAGANTYNGVTTISSGTLALGAGGSLGGTAVTAGGASNAALQSTANNTIGTAGSPNLNLTANTGSISLLSGASNTLSIDSATAGATVLTVNGGNTLSFDSTISGGDAINLGAGLKAIATGSNTIAVNLVNRPAASQMLTLINAPGGFTGNSNFTLSTSGASTFGLALALNFSNPNQVNLVETITPAPNTAYFVGSKGASWAANDGTFGNFSSDQAGTTLLTTLPNTNTDVHFQSTNANSSSVSSSTLDTPLAIKTLTIDGTTSGAVGIGAGTNGVLTITPTSSAVGLMVSSGAGVVSISSPIVLGANQTWTNNSSNGLTVSGAVSGSGSLTQAGAGTLTLSGASSYTGGTTLNSSTLLVGNSTALGTGTVNMTGGTFASTATVNIANAINVTGTNTIGYASQTNNITLSGAVTGNGTLMNFIGTSNGSNLFFTGNLTGFTGNFNYTERSGSDTQWWRVGASGATTDLSNASVILNIGNVTNTNAFSKNFGFTDGITNAYVRIGALSGNGVFQSSYNNSGPNTLEVGALNTSTTFSGVIAGGNAGTNMNLTKVGTGTLTLSGTNLYTGTTTIDAGTISISNDSNIGAGGPVTLNGGTLLTTAGVYNTHTFTIGSSGGTIDVTTNGQYFFNIYNVLQGSGPLTLTGDGTLTANTGNLRLNQGNTYSGAMTIQSGGILEYGTGGAVDPAATMTIGNQGEVAVNTGVTLPNSITVTGGTNSVLSFENGTTGIFSGSITLNANAIVGLRDWYNYADVRSGTISGIISGSGGLTVNSGSGTGGLLTLSAANTFTGNVTVNNATVDAAYGANDFNTGGRPSGSFGNEQTPGKTVTINSGGTVSFTTGNVLGSGGSSVAQAPVLTFVVNAGGVLQTAAADASGGGGGDANILGNITLNGGTLTTGNGYNAVYQAAILLGTVTVGGTSASTINTNATNTTANGVMLGVSGGTIFNVASTGGSGPDLTVSVPLTDGAGGGVGSLVKTGAGRMQLGAINTYSGSTTISAGILSMTGAGLLPSTTNVSVASGATLSVNGTAQTIASLTGPSGSFVTLGSGTLTMATTGGATFSGIISGTGNIGMTGAGTQVLGGTDTYTGTTSVTTGTLNLGSNRGTSTLLVRNSTGITITNGKLLIGASVSHTNRDFFYVSGSGLSISGNTNAWTGTLDLSSNDMDIANAGVAGLATITNQIKSGFANGAWNGPGIQSSAAANDSTHLTALGVILNGGTYGSSKPFDTITPGANDVLIKYTYYGDADLSGHVDGTDYSLIDSGFGGAGTGWQYGDFNYDGVIDGSDYSLIDNTFNQQTTAGYAVQVATQTSEIAAGSTAVPEPGCSMFLSILVTGLLARRRKSRSVERVVHEV